MKEKTEKKLIENLLFTSNAQYFRFLQEYICLKMKLNPNFAIQEDAKILYPQKVKRKWPPFLHQWIFSPSTLNCENISVFAFLCDREKFSA